MRKVLLVLLLFTLALSTVNALKISDNLQAKLDSQEQVKVMITEDGKTIYTKISKNEFQNLKNVEAIEEDEVLTSFLDVSAGIINATKTWNLTYYGTSLEGTSQTVCVLDTGINYEHPALGNCSARTVTVNGNNESYNLHSETDSGGLYTGNYDNTTTITMPGYTSVAVYFSKLYTEPYYDFVYIYDGSDNLIATYFGEYKNFWSANVSGDTIKIRLKTDTYLNHSGYNITQVLNGSASYAYDWSNCTTVVGAYNAMTNDTNIEDYNSHGTHVSGIIASQNLSYKGISPKTKIYSVKVLDDEDGNGYSEVIQKGMQHCIDNSESYNISVISMSLGSSTSHYSSYCDSSAASWSQKVQAAVSKNISVIISSGNENKNSEISLPACIENATAVGASTDSDSVASYSNHANILDLLAPGSTINSPVLGTSWSSSSGTSMAAPHVSAAFAILKQFGLLELNKTLTPSEIETALENTGVNLTKSGTSITKPRIDIYEAVLSLDNKTPTVSYINPTPLNSVENNTNISIRINSSELVENIVLYLNSQNYSMTQEGTEWYYNLTANTSLSFNVTGTDLANNSFTLETRNLIINAIPQINLTSPNTTNVNIIEPNNKSFNITFYDSDNDIINISWYFNGILQSNAVNNTEFNFTGNYTSAGNHNITVSITDGVATTTNYWNFTINNTNRIVNLTSYQPNTTNVTINENSSFQFNQTTTDQDNDDTISYYWYSNGILNSTNENLTFNSSFESAGSYNITLVVSDSYSNVSNYWNLTVENVNRKPNLNVTITPSSIYNNTNITCNYTYSDPDNNTMNYSLIKWRINNVENTTYENQTLINYTQTERFQNWTCLVTVSDGNLTNNKNETVLIANSPASITSKSPSSTNINIDEPENKTFSISYSDLEADNVSIKWLQNGSVKSTNSSYVFNGGYSTAGVYNITVVLNDTYDLTTNYWQLTVDDTSQTTNEETVTTNEQPPQEEEEEEEQEEEQEEEEQEIREVEYSNDVVSGETIEFLFDEGLTEVNKINLVTKNDLDIVFVTTTKLEEKPAEIQEPETLIYSYIEITAENVEVETAEIHFTVEKSWLEENNFTKESVRMLRFNGTWEELHTGLVEEKEESIEYEAISPGFSTFAISAGITAEEVEVVTTSSVNKDMPQIEGMRYLMKVFVYAISIVLVILFVLLLFLKFKK